jgi:hypothetical protein
VQAVFTVHFSLTEDPLDPPYGAVYTAWIHTLWWEVDAGRGKREAVGGARAAGAVCAVRGREAALRWQHSSISVRGPPARAMRCTIM